MRSEIPGLVRVRKVTGRGLGGRRVLDPKAAVERGRGRRVQGRWLRFAIQDHGTGSSFCGSGCGLVVQFRWDARASG